MIGAIIALLMNASTTTAQTQYHELMQLVIDKSNLQAHLLTLPPQGQSALKIANFRVAVGKKNGDKQQQGDLKTPEGIYLTMKHIEGEKLYRPKYGKLAIPINFPNPFDLYQKKSGYGIWLHGAGDDKRIAKNNVTEGCVAFYNDDIIRLRQWLQPKKSIVVIKNTLNDSKKLHDIKKQVYQVVLSWLAAWKNRNIEDYMSYYAPNFVLSGRNKSAYKTYKQKVFKRYLKMIINVSHLRVIAHEKYAIALMNQDFWGDKFSSLGSKVLYLVKSSKQQWQILREDFENHKFIPLQFNDQQIMAINDAKTTIL